MQNQKGKTCGLPGSEKCQDNNRWQTVLDGLDLCCTIGIWLSEMWLAPTDVCC